MRKTSQKIDCIFLLSTFCLLCCFSTSVYAGCLYNEPLDTDPLTIMLPKECGFCGIGCASNTVPHKGVDFKASKDDKVYAVCDGKILLNTTSREILDSFLIIEHNCSLEKFYAFYGHISSNLKEKDPVKKGDEIGTIKEWNININGKVFDNAHLHFGINSDYQSTNWGYASSGDTCQDVKNMGWRNPVDFLGLGDLPLVVGNFYYKNTLHLVENQLFDAQAKIYNNSDGDYQVESAALEIYDADNLICSLQLKSISETIALCGFLHLAGDTSNCQTNLTAGNYKVAVRIKSISEWKTISEQNFTIDPLPFADITTDNRYFDVIAFLYERGIVQGHPDGTFRPDDDVNRAEFSKMLVGLAEKAGKKFCEISPEDLVAAFPDLKLKDQNEEYTWYLGYIGKLKEGVSTLDETGKSSCKGIIDGYPDGLFRPGNTINMAEMIKMIIQTFAEAAPRKKGEEWYVQYLEPATGKIEPIWDGSKFRSATTDDAAMPVTRAMAAKAMYDAYLNFKK